MTGNERLAKVLNERGYLVLRTNYQCRPGDILGNATLALTATSEPRLIEANFYVISETDEEEFWTQAEFGGWPTEGEISSSRFYRCTTD